MRVATALCHARAARLAATVLLLVGLRPAVAATVATARAPAGAVATEHPAAAAAGADVLRAGGNAVDAAIATAAAVCVVHPSSCGIGGGGFALVRTADRRVAVLDFRETAPATATRDRYVDPDGTAHPERLRRGGLAVGVPGEVRGWVALHARYGRLPLPRVLAPAVALARGGVALTDAPALARQIAANIAVLAADPPLRATFLDAGGAPPGPAFRIVQPDLARVLEDVGARGADAFYRGPVAAALVSATTAHGGVLSLADLAGYRPVWRQPLRGSVRGRSILTMPPPGGGPIVLTILGILARDEPEALGAGSPTWLHLLAGAMADAFSDRARWYGDPAFVDVPVDTLLAPARLAGLRAGLSSVGVAAPEAHAAHDAGTANVAVVDAEGAAVALTTTINGPFGAGFAAPGTGIVLNNEMDDFEAAPGVPNEYGLVGTGTNAVAPGKRPLSSMAPTIVERDGRVELVTGGSGGPTIITGVTQVILGVTAFGDDAAAAVAAPRIHDQAVPPVLAVEPGVDATTRAALTRVGHTLRDVPSLGAESAISIDRNGRVVAAGDPRKDGGAAVVPRRGD